MTENSDKIRAVVLAALMVFSVFAGTVALSGTAAAFSGGDVSLGDQTPGATTTYTVSGTFEETTTVSAINVQLGGTNMSGVQAEDVTITQGNGTVQSVTPDGNNLSISLTDSADLSGTVNIAIDSVTNAETAGVYTGNISTSAESGSLGSFVVGQTTNDGALLFAGQEVVYSTAGDAEGDYVLREGSPNDDSTTAIRQLRVNDGLISIDTGELDTGSYYITNSGPNQANLTFEVIVQDFSAEFSDDSVGNDGSSADTTVEFSSSNRASDFDVNVTAEDGNVDDDELVEVFNDTNYNVTNPDVDDDADTDDDGIRIEDVSDGAEVSTSFQDIDPDEYNFSFQVVDTGVEDSASIEVTETQEGALSFNESTVEENQGDIATINVTFNEAASEGHLVVGDYDESGYQANITLEDGNGDGVVQVMFNTYTAGSDPADAGEIVWAADSDDSASLANGASDYQAIGNDLLDTTSNGYQLAVRQTAGTSFNNTLDNPDELGTLFLEDRSTENISTWVAPDGVYDNYDDFDEAQDVTNAIEEGALTQSSTLAEGDVMVFQVQASGLAGLFEGNVGSSSAVVDYLSSDTPATGVSLNLEGPDRPNQPTQVVDLSTTSSMDVITTEDNQVFIVMDTQDSGLEWQEGGAVDDETLNTNFTVQDDRLLGSTDEDDHQSVSTEFESAEPDAEFDEEPIQVPATENAAITGTTNIAPGSEITVRVQSTDSEARFIKTNESVVVQPDGTFSAMFDFTDDATVGDQFEATIRNYGGDQVTADGEVVEGNNTTTTSDNTTTSNVTDTTTTDGETTTTDGETTTADGETTTADGETTTAGGDGETTTTTPGFTSVLAVIALIGAALVAVRRDN